MIFFSELQHNICRFYDFFSKIKLFSLNLFAFVALMILILVFAHFLNLLVCSWFRRWRNTLIWLMLLYYSLPDDRFDTGHSVIIKGFLWKIDYKQLLSIQCTYTFSYYIYDICSIINNIYSYHTTLFRIVNTFKIGIKIGVKTLFT